METQLYSKVKNLGALQLPVTQMIQRSLQKRYQILEQVAKDIGYTEFTFIQKKKRIEEVKVDDVMLGEDLSVDIFGMRLKDEDF